MVSRAVLPSADDDGWLADDMPALETSVIELSFELISAESTAPVRSSGSAAVGDASAIASTDARSEWTLRPCATHVVNSSTLRAPEPSLSSSANAARACRSLSSQPRARHAFLSSSTPIVPEWSESYSSKSVCAMSVCGGSAGACVIICRSHSCCARAPPFLPVKTGRRCAPGSAPCPGSAGGLARCALRIVLSMEVSASPSPPPPPPPPPPSEEARSTDEPRELHVSRSAEASRPPSPPLEPSSFANDVSVESPPSVSGCLQMPPTAARIAAIEKRCSSIGSTACPAPAAASQAVPSPALTMLSELSEAPPAPAPDDDEPVREEHDAPSIGGWAPSSELSASALAPQEASDAPSIGGGRLCSSRLRASAATRTAVSCSFRLRIASSCSGVSAARRDGARRGDVAHSEPFLPRRRGVSPALAGESLVPDAFE